MSNMTVAKTILEQLGGNKFRAMTGAKQFMGFAEGLAMKIGLFIVLHYRNIYQLKLKRKDSI